MSDCIFELEEGDTVAPVLFPAIPFQDLGVIKNRLMRELDIDILEGAAHALGVRTEEEARNALSMALQARKLEKTLEESRAHIVKPHFDYQKSINNLVKDFKDKFAYIEETLKKKIDAWMIDQQENPFTAVDRLEVEDGTITTKKSYDFVVEDERLVPIEYKMVDAVAIEKAVKFGIRHIPGVKIYEKTKTTLRVKNT